MAIGNWQDIQFNANIPSLPELAVNVARRLNVRRPMQRQSYQPRISRISSLTQPNISQPVINQPENISPMANMMSNGTGLSRAWDLVQKWEGGYSNDPDDSGGETNFGIAKNFNPGVDVKNITKQDAMNIFRDKYYNPSGAERMSPALGLYLADAAFNQGLGGMRDIMKNAIGTTDIDAMNAMDQKQVLEAVHNARMNRYRSHDKWDKYGKGWTNRANDALARAMALLGG